MADRNHLSPAALLPRAPDEIRAQMDAEVLTPEMVAAADTHRRPARPDPETGEVRAGPGDAGLSDRPEINAGSSGTEQMSNNRLAIGLGIVAVLAILVFGFANLL